MTRALAFITLRVLEVALAVVFPFAPSACLLAVYALDPLHERLARGPLNLDDYSVALAAGRERT